MKQNHDFLQEVQEQANETKQVNISPNLNIPLHGRFATDIPQQQIATNLGGTNVAYFSRNEMNRMDLANLAWAYKDPDFTFIGSDENVMPMRPVTSLKSKVRVMAERTFYDRANTLQGGQSSPSARVTYESTYTDYDLSQRSLAIVMSDIEKDEAVNQWGSVAKWRSVNTMLLTHLLRLDLELEIATLLQADATYASGYYADVSNSWAGTLGTPKADVITAEDTPILAPKNRMIFGHDVYRACQKSAQITGDTTVSGPKRSTLQPYVNLEAIQNYFDCPISVGSALYNSTPASTTPTYTRIWLNYAIVCHQTSPGGNDLAPSFCMNLKLQSPTFPNVNGWTVKSVRDELNSLPGAEILMVGYWIDPVVFSQKLGYKLKAIV